MFHINGSCVFLRNPQIKNSPVFAVFGLVDRYYVVNIDTLEEKYLKYEDHHIMSGVNALMMDYQVLPVLKDEVNDLLIRITKSKGLAKGILINGEPVVGEPIIVRRSYYKHNTSAHADEYVSVIMECNSEKRITLFGCIGWIENQVNLGELTKRGGAGEKYVTGKEITLKSGSKYKVKHDGLFQEGGSSYIPYQVFENISCKMPDFKSTLIPEHTKLAEGVVINGDVFSIEDIEDIKNFYFNYLTRPRRTKV